MRWVTGIGLVVALMAVPAAAVGHPAAAARSAVRAPALNVGHPARIAGPLRGRFDGVRSHVSTARALSQSAARTTLQMWSRNVSDHGSTFHTTIVGKNPFVTQTTPSTTVQTYLIWLRLTVTNTGDVYDPSASEPCDPTGASPLSRVEASPVFKTKAYTWGGTAIGTAQYVDAFQRAEFWSQTNPSGINPGYHVKLSSLTSSNVVGVNVTINGTPTERVGTCKADKLLIFPISTWDSYIQNTLIPYLQSHGVAVGPTNLPIFLLHNVVFSNGSQCCILGYHNAYGSPTQVYGVGDYDTTQDFPSAVDVSVLAHEVGEAINDPLTNNPTKPWGHIGQVSTCQSNLEVGDPLTGTTIKVPLGGFTYHPQELAFFSWFYHQSPSIGANGWYSNHGTFTSPAAACP